MLDKMEDASAKQERSRVMSLPLNSATFAEFPMIIKEIRKQYGGSHGRVANYSLCLAVERHQVFGLLGPNGAGMLKSFSHFKHRTV